MPRTRECDFCGGDVEPGKGTMFVYADGTTVTFCSSKCEKNADLGREARDVEWTEAGQAAGGAPSGATDRAPPPTPASERGPDSEEPAAAESRETEEQLPEDEIAPDLEAAEGSEDLDEPEPESEVAQPDEGATGEGTAGAAEADDTSAEAEEAPGDRGDEDDQPVVDAGGGEEAAGVEDATREAESESAAEAETEVVEDDEQ